VKPDGPVAHRRDYDVRAIEHANAVALIEQAHYARGAANTSVFAHGLFRTGGATLVGVALWMPPTRVCAESVDREHWRAVLALSRLVVLHGEPKMATGILLGASIRRVRRDGRWVALVTYADPSEGHDGTIYRATGWSDEGLVQAKAKWVDDDGRMIAIKSAGHSRTVAEMEALGCTVTANPQKRRFTMRLRQAPKTPPQLPLFTGVQ
jgi:hypothetical protein